MKKLLYSLSVVAAILFYSSSCTKITTTELGSELIPAVDNVTVFDTTLEVVTEIYPLADSTRMFRSYDHVFGIMEDPSFGTTSGELYVQLKPAFFGAYPFGSSKDSIIGVDSVVLSLKYKSLYGDSNAIQNIKVYEVAQESGFKDSLLGYNINRESFPVTNLLGEKNNLDFRTLNDSLQYVLKKDTTRTVNELRIPLDIAFAQRLVNYDTTIYKTDSAFTANFRGFAIKADASSPIRKALAAVNLADGVTRLSVYFRYKKNGQPDTTLTTFVFRQDSYANANFIKRDPAGSDYANNLATGANNKQELFIQTSPGSYALVKIPALQNLSNRLVYKASLIIEKLDGQQDNFFVPPSLLFLDAVDSANNRFLTIPKSFTPVNTSALGYNPAIFGGFLKNGRYEFDLGRYVQGIVTNKDKSYALRLYAPFITKPSIVVGSTVAPYEMTINSPVTRGRSVLAGGAHPTKKMRLYIVYSKI
ncbi:DUF4270 domain-containing protein [Flavihumibacter rivuli]|uniref:DUF4270 family protein n=1 Tax=Flavihumibacter rivuli TaxID=2838156 RepID=UPI001BDEAE3F|nr:DUF4270 family protein [Flavihumibacter rivuli]ULQ57805.1 DUF4270 domain-containing protein [Flavihumibacter rivuli]